MLKTSLRTRWVYMLSFPFSLVDTTPTKVEHLLILPPCTWMKWNFRSPLALWHLCEEGGLLPCALLLLLSLGCKTNFLGKERWSAPHWPPQPSGIEELKGWVPLSTLLLQGVTEAYFPTVSCGHGAREGEVGSILLTIPLLFSSHIAHGLGGSAPHWAHIEGSVGEDRRAK